MVKIFSNFEKEFQSHPNIVYKLSSCLSSFNNLKQNISPNSLMSFFDFLPTDNEGFPQFQDNLVFDDLSINPDAEAMFQAGCNKY